MYFPLSSESWQPLTNITVWGAVLYMGILSTALAIFLQINFQKQVGATRTSLIFNLDLVSASIFGMVNKEPLYANQILGGLAIFIAAMLEPIINLRKNKKQD